jgi:hypothetical protein
VNEVLFVISNLLERGEWTTTWDLDDGKTRAFFFDRCKQLVRSYDDEVSSNHESVLVLIRGDCTNQRLSSGVDPFAQVRALVNSVFRARRYMVIVHPGDGESMEEGIETINKRFYHGNGDALVEGITPRPYAYSLRGGTPELSEIGEWVKGLAWLLGRSSRDSFVKCLSALCGAAFQVEAHLPAKDGLRPADQARSRSLAEFLRQCPQRPYLYSQVVRARAHEIRHLFFPLALDLRGLRISHVEDRLAYAQAILDERRQRALTGGHAFLQRWASLRLLVGNERTRFRDGSELNPGPGAPQTCGPALVEIARELVGLHDAKDSCGLAEELGNLCALSSNRTIAEASAIEAWLADVDEALEREKADKLAAVLLERANEFREWFAKLAQTLEKLLELASSSEEIKRSPQASA